jgi:ferredoxin-type protein NapH
MKTNKLRVIIPLVILLIAGIGFTLHTGFGNLSAIGWDSVSILCPLGALGTMLASKTIIPRAVISLVIAVVAIILLGRAFCGWVCPVPVVSKLRTVFAKGKPEADATQDANKAENAEGVTSDTFEKGELSASEKKLLKTACGNKLCGHDCQPSNSRHLVLGGALLSTAIFGFPVFCLVCPIGLTFALVFVLINLFGAGDVTWSVIAIPVVLLLEVVFFRKWCSHICPLSSLMSLVGKLNRTLLPHVKEDACIETHGGHCGKCAEVCEVGIDPRHPELGASWSECTRCRACVENCPTKAISMPFIAPKAAAKKLDDQAVSD